MKANEIMEVLELMSPARLACDWDNSGLNIGRGDKDVKKVLITVDVDDVAVEKAVSQNVDMIISHHPLLFRGVKQINDDTFLGKRLLRIINNDINVFCMHTNFDASHMGDAAAASIGLIKENVMEETAPGYGIGVFGRFDSSIKISDLCELVKKKFMLEKVELYGNEDDVVTHGVIVPGSGKDYIDQAINMKAGVYITGDMTYHYAIDAVSQGLNIIDAGHYGIEHIFMEMVSNHLDGSFLQLEILTMPVNNPKKYV